MKIKYLSICEDNQDSCKYVETGEILISKKDYIHLKWALVQY